MNYIRTRNPFLLRVFGGRDSEKKHAPLVVPGMIGVERGGESRAKTEQWPNPELPYTTLYYRDQIRLV